MATVIRQSAFILHFEHCQRTGGCNADVDWGPRGAVIASVSEELVKELYESRVVAPDRDRLIRRYQNRPLACDGLEFGAALSHQACQINRHELIGAQGGFEAGCLRGRRYKVLHHFRAAMR